MMPCLGNGRKSRCDWGRRASRRQPSTKPLPEDAVVVEGEVSLYRDAPGKPVMLRMRADRGDFFGEMGLFDDAPRNANVIALTPMTLMVLDGPALRQLEREQPELASRISATIGRRRRWLEPAL